jgi:hypothetical protein
MVKKALMAARILETCGEACVLFDGEKSLSQGDRKLI